MHAPLDSFPVSILAYSAPLPFKRHWRMMLQLQLQLVSELWGGRHIKGPALWQLDASALLTSASLRSIIWPNVPETVCLYCRAGVSVGGSSNR